MIMNTNESYVSLETAKLLKQAGFDWECMCYYSVNTLHEPNNGFIHIYKQYKELFYDHNKTKMPVYSAPTLAVAQRWLMEEKECDVNVLTDFDSVRRFYYVRYVIKDGHYKVFYITDRQSYTYFNTYEEAQEAGIKKCLTLILEEDE